VSGEKKWVVPAVPIGKPLMTFMLPIKSKHVKIISGFRGISLGLPEQQEARR